MLTPSTDRLVERRRSLAPGLAQGLRGGDEALPGRLGRRRQRGARLLALVELGQAAGQLVAQRRQRLDLDPVLAGQVAQREVTLFDLLQPARVEVQVAGDRLQLGGRLLGLGQRPVERFERRGQAAAGLLGDPPEIAPGLGQGAVRRSAVGAGQARQGGGDRLDQLFPVQQELSLLGQVGLLAGLGIEPVQLLHRVA